MAYVAPPSNTGGLLGHRALSARRLARLGATPDFHHGLLEVFHEAELRRRDYRLEQSYVGAMFTGGNPASQLSSSTMGVDMRLATSAFLGSDRNVVFNAYGLKSNNEGVSENNSSYGFGAQYPNDKFAAQIL